MVFVEDRIASYFQIAPMSVNHDKNVVHGHLTNRLTNIS